jgi:hypothetical protein
MLKKPVSFVLASLIGSTLRGTPRIFRIMKGLIRLPRTIEKDKRLHEVRSVLLASSLAAALLNGLFEYLAHGPMLNVEW